MAKRRKTREQKMLTATRRLTAVPTPIIPVQTTYSLPTVFPKIVSSSSPIILTHAYDYVTKDLLRTTFVTSTIILAQLILFSLVRGR